MGKVLGSSCNNCNFLGGGEVRGSSSYHEIFNPLSAELNPICHLLAVLEAHHILDVSRIRFKRTRFCRMPREYHLLLLRDVPFSKFYLKYTYFVRDTLGLALTATTRTLSKLVHILTHSLLPSKQPTNLCCEFLLTFHDIAVPVYTTQTLHLPAFLYSVVCIHMAPTVNMYYSTEQL